MHTYSDGQHVWDVQILWAMAEMHKAVEVRLADIPNVTVNLMESYCWTKTGEWVKALTVAEILKHADRVEKADLTKPIILTPDGCVADGIHRIIKAIRKGESSILAVRLPIMPPPLSEFEPT